MSETVFQIGKEMISTTGMALANKPARNELSIRVQRDPRPGSK